MEYMFSIPFRKHRDEKKENNLITLVINENVNSLCSRHHYVTARASCVSRSSYINMIFNQSARVLSSTVF